MKAFTLIACFFTTVIVNAAITTVPRVDVARYMGTWYEIARLPQSFQRMCGATRVIYTLREDGKVDVQNMCQDKDDKNKLHQAHGTAFVTESETNSKLKVSFVPFLQRWGFFAGNYWVIGLDETNYTWAMVGEGTGKYLWILSRTPTMTPEFIQELLSRAHVMGINTESIIYSPEWKNY